MPLPSTKYPNNIRVVSGSLTPFNDDVVLECDTSSAPVTINLDTFPSNYWSTTWKLFILDNSNNAINNNITINAPNGYLINGLSQVVISNNGGGGFLVIGNNLNYIWTQNTGIVPLYDSGWKYLNGFNWIIDSPGATLATSLKPQYRIVDKSIIFRNNWIIPLADGSSNVIPYQVTGGISTYESAQFVAPYLGSGGISKSDGGAIFFNQGQRALDIADIQYFPDNNYTTPFLIGERRVFTSAGANFEVLLSTVAIMEVTSDGVILLDLLSDAETGINAGWSGLGSSNLRFLTSQVKAGQYIPAYINIPMDYGGVNPPGFATNMTDLSGNIANFLSNPTTTPLQIKVANSTNAGSPVTHLLTLDPNNPNQMGGFQFNPSLLKAYTN